MFNKRILVLPGDGIGVEVMDEVLKLIEWMVKNKSFLEFESLLPFGLIELPAVGNQ